MMKPDIDEALRYLGVSPPAPAQLRIQAEEMAAQLSAAIRPRWTWRVFPLLPEGGSFSLSGTTLALTGETARTMLSRCRAAVLLACTLGVQFDALLRQRQARDMSEAVLLDACGSALVEAGCGEAEAEIAARLPGKFLTDRFSPGYGDLPLELQPNLCALLDAHRRLGVTVTESLLLNPSKTVTAIVGVADDPQPARVRGCGHCSLREQCAVRQTGGCGRAVERAHPAPEQAVI